MKARFTEFLKGVLWFFLWVVLHVVVWALNAIEDIKRRFAR